MKPRPKPQTLFLSAVEITSPNNPPPIEDPTGPRPWGFLLTGAGSLWKRPAPMATPPVPACSRKHCSNIATVVPVLRIPAIGGDKVNALTLPLGFPLCAGHARTVNAGEFTSRKSTFRARIHSFCRSLGDARPDFPKAWLDFETRA
jgi:hypothetical protein